MKLRLFIFVIITFYLGCVAHAQVAVDNTLSVHELITEYLIGEGIEVANITINGQGSETVNNQAGLYTGTSNFIDFDEGIVMVTGNAQTAVGGMETPLTNPIMSDLDLMILASQNINDAIIIEFDFLASRDSIKFNYVFASREYPTYTCTQFNDVFGFFLSGPGIDGPFLNNAKNIALIPGTEIPVGINTINSGHASGAGNAQNCFDANPDWLEHSQYFVNNSYNPMDDIQYPGMTQTFTAMSEVQCGEWYHIKLAIGDADDTGWNSAVFLESGSFTGFGDVYLSLVPHIDGIALTNPAFEDVLVAGCSEAFIELTRPEGMSADSVFVEFGGTAIMDVDYVFDDMDTLFFFPNGIDTLGFTITTLWDGVGRDDRSFTVYIHFVDGCGSLKSDSASIDIVDPYFLGSQVSSVEIFCPTDKVLISAEGLDGIEPYTYDWGDYGQGEGLNEVSVDVQPEDSVYYQVSISDKCAFEHKLDSVLVVNNMVNPLQAVIGMFSDPVCSNEAVEMHASIQNGSGEFTIIWGDGQDRIYPQEESIIITNTNDKINFIPDPIGFIDNLLVYLTVTDTCGTTVRDTVQINYPWIEPIKANFNPLTDHCPTDPIRLSSTTKNGFGDYNYEWEGEFVSDANKYADHIYAMPTAGKNEYSLKVSDYCSFIGADFEVTRWDGNHMTIGRSGSDIHTDSINIIDLNNIMNVITPDGDNKNDYFVVEGIQEFDNTRLEVYDRWGKMIYESDNYRAGKMGSARPDDVFDADGYKDGTYFYIINVNSGECVQSGTIEVLRGNN